MQLFHHASHPFRLIFHYHHHLTRLEKVGMVCSVYVLLALILEITMTLPHLLHTPFKILDALACCVFLYEFFIRFRAANNKLQFMKWGWIDLLASIPLLDSFFRTLRLISVIRIVRFLHAYHATHELDHVLEHYHS